MRTKHTPGPWVVGKPFNTPSETVMASVFVDDETDFVGPTSLATVKLADAHLIAAAPDLLEDASLVVTEYLRIKDSLLHEQREQLSVWIGRLDFSIRKAKGENESI